MKSNKCPGSYFLDDGEDIFEYINRKRYEFIEKHRFEPNAVIMDKSYIDNTIMASQREFGYGFNNMRILGLEVVWVVGIYKPIVCLMEFTD